MYLDVVLASLALLPYSVAAAGLYPKGSSVLNIDASNYDKLIAKSNYTSIVEFYAPWCGHCQNLKGPYEKAATSLAGIAKVAAINCDDEENKQFCGSMGVQGFPTLKIVKPSKKKGKPIVEDYQGQRTAKAINDAVVDKVPNHVTKLKNDGLDKWLGTEPARSKALFFSEKGSVSPMVKALAIDFLGAMDIAHVQSSQKAMAEKYGVTAYPSVVLLPGADKEPIKYDGDMKKASLITFFSQAASPNPDAVPDTAEKKSKTSSKKDAKSKKAGKKSSTPAAPTAASETLESNTPPTASPDPQVSSNDAAPPVRLPVQPAPKLMALESEAALQKTCLHSKAAMCILAFTPPSLAESTTERTTKSTTEGAASSEDSTSTMSEHAGLLHLREIAHKHKQRGAKIFPFYSIPDTNTAGATLLSSLQAEGAAQVNAIEGFTLLAVNAKKGWWSPYSGEVVGRTAIEAWIDGLRFGEGKKVKLPEGLVGEIVEEVAEKEKEEVKEKKEEKEEKIKVQKSHLPDEEMMREEVLRRVRDKERQLKARREEAQAQGATGFKSGSGAGDANDIEIEIIEVDEHDEL